MTEEIEIAENFDEEAEDLLFEWELFEKGLNPEDFPVIERVEPPPDEVPDWFENI